MDGDGLLYSVVDDPDASPDVLAAALAENDDLDFAALYDDSNEVFEMRTMANAKEAREAQPKNMKRSHFPVQKLFYVRLLSLCVCYYLRHSAPFFLMLKPQMGAELDQDIRVEGQGGQHQGHWN